MGRSHERQDQPVLLGGQVGPDTHVEHRHVPLGVTVGTGRSNVVAVPAGLRPELRSCLGRGNR